MSVILTKLSENAWSSRIETCNFIMKRLRNWCFPRSFAKFLITHILQNIDVRKIYSFENIYMEFLATVYLVKKRLTWCLLNKQKKCTSLNEVSETLGIYKKTILLNKRTSAHSYTHRSIIPNKTSP